MFNQSVTRRAYLVRCWRDGTSRWRFSIEEVLRERHVRGFGNLNALIVFLRDEFARDEKEALLKIRNS